VAAKAPAWAVVISTMSISITSHIPSDTGCHPLSRLGLDKLHLDALDRVEKNKDILNDLLLLVRDNGPESLQMKTCNSNKRWACFFIFLFLCF
jgi:hypothetical protein